MGCLSVLLWPFRMLWLLVTSILNVVGRLLGVVLGLVLMIAGAVLTFTIVGAVVGIPLLLLGLMLIVRSLF